jgi:hypothetical protein
MWGNRHSPLSRHQVSPFFRTSSILPAMGVRTRGQHIAARLQSSAAGAGAREEATRVIERWNAALAAGPGALWSPTIKCAVIAATPWLDVYCPGCRTGRAIDLRTIDRHPLASVANLVLGLRCSWCPGRAPMPVITGLHPCPPAARRADVV